MQDGMLTFYLRTGGSSIRIILQNEIYPRESFYAEADAIGCFVMMI